MAITRDSFLIRQGIPSCSRRPFNKLTSRPDQLLAVRNFLIRLWLKAANELGGSGSVPTVDGGGSAGAESSRSSGGVIFATQANDERVARLSAGNYARSQRVQPLV